MSGHRTSEPQPEEHHAGCEHGACYHACPVLKWSRSQRPKEAEAFEGRFPVLTFDNGSRTNEAPSKMACAFASLLPLRDGADVRGVALDLDGMFERVRREAVEARPEPRTDSAVPISKLAGAWLSLTQLADGVEREHAARELDALLDRVRRETVEQCEAAHKAGIPWQRPEPAKDPVVVFDEAFAGTTWTKDQRGERAKTSLPEWPPVQHGSITKDGVVGRLCDLLFRVWDAHDPNAHEPNDCFCGENRIAAGMRFQNAGQALKWVELVVEAALAARSAPSSPTATESK